MSQVNGRLRGRGAFVTFKGSEEMKTAFPSLTTGQMSACCKAIITNGTRVIEPSRSVFQTSISASDVASDT